ncbi:MAG: triose-phosphate isomerase [Gammaproteobacteria bacterium]|nr:triose-phosphate isomerase [Gammaproteobacteria bacterium]MCZ6716896.1 triose-phosphate isomerase [Gammaproteobacteria bacterium]MCZ6913019.1 triose-phosphate isomerase [Pseudomonadota bacterium]
MRKPFVAGNWKMHGSRHENQQLIAELIDKLPAEINSEVLVCAPFVYLQEIERQIRDSGIQLGGQSVCAEAAGAFTGEISTAMLVDVGCSHVIVGHSERRALYHEDDALVARKFVAAQQGGLVPILCIGEFLAEREADQTFAVVGRQLDAVLDVAGIEAFENAIVAYEPVWAIGTGLTATPQQAQEVHAFIRARLVAQDATIGGSVRLLYGGSVKAANAAELFTEEDVDGGLVGGASLKGDEFAKICVAAG